MEGHTAFLIAPLLAAGTCFAQQYPERPLRVIVPYAAGGVSDAVIRLMTTRAEPQLGQPIVVEGSAPATQALMAGEVQAIFGLPASFRPLEASGKARVLASIYPRRPAHLADVPTFAELGYPDVVLPQTTFFLVRRGAPADRLAKLSDVMTSVAALPEVGKACLDTGGEVVTARGAALQRHADDEIQRWSSAAARAKFAPSE